MNKKIQILVRLNWILFLVSGLVQAKTIVVFIHGTVLPGLSLLDASHTYHDTLSETSRYVASVKNIRNDTRFWEDQAVLGEGLWPIMTIKDQEQQDVCQKDERFAVYPLTRAFDAVGHWAGYLDNEVTYYAFGHLGLLSQEYRKKQGFLLYKELVCLVKAEKKPVRIIICAHSHGGNIALHLAAAEARYHQGLFIDDLLLFGTPVQVETASYAFQKPFKRVISFFSASDTIQISDWLSTKSSTSFRTFTVPHRHSEIRYVPSKKSFGQVIDVRCQVNGDTRCLTHQNFWYLGRSRRLCDSMQLLPLMVLAPVYATLLRPRATTYTLLVDAHLNQKCCSQLMCSLVFPGKEQQTLSEREAQQLGKLVQYYDRDAQMNWKPVYKHRILLLYREDFMREMLGLFSWLDFKVRLWGYKALKSVHKWFGSEQHR